MKGLNRPVGVSDFAEIRQNGYYYVDKTGLICELLKTTGTKVLSMGCHELSAGLAV